MIRGILNLMVIVLCAGCVSIEVDHGREMTSKNTEAYGKYHDIIVDVKHSDALHIRENVYKRLSQLINYSIATEFSDKFFPVIVEEASVETLHIQVVIVRYNDGTALTTWAFQPPGNMRIDSEVIVSDWYTKKNLAEFGVSKTYDLNDIHARNISVEELEYEFTQELITRIAQHGLPQFQLDDNKRSL